MDPRTIDATPDLDLNLQDIKIYREGDSSQIPKDAVVTYKTKKYRIREISDRNDEGGFTFWIGKRITE
jgi:hypothetical protein